MWCDWDLGATFCLSQLNVLEYPLGFATTGHSNSHQLVFEWLTSDGSPIPTEGDDTIQSPFDYQLLSFVDNFAGGAIQRSATSGANAIQVPTSERTIKFDFRFDARHRAAHGPRVGILIGRRGDGDPTEFVGAVYNEDIRRQMPARQHEFPGGDRRRHHAQRPYQRNHRRFTGSIVKQESGVDRRQRGNRDPLLLYT